DACASAYYWPSRCVKHGCSPAGRGVAVSIIIAAGPGQGATMAWRIGVDIGGTFTDVALVDDASGRIGVAKVPTTPADLADGVLAALGTAMERHGVAPADVGLLSHATTIVTNAILEERGA